MRFAGRNDHLTNQRLLIFVAAGLLTGAFAPVYWSLVYGATNYFNGHIRKIIYWPTALGNAETEDIISYQ